MKNQKSLFLTQVIAQNFEDYYETKKLELNEVTAEIIKVILIVKIVSELLESGAFPQV